jgi:hypothetical protein
LYTQPFEEINKMVHTKEWNNWNPARDVQQDTHIEHQNSTGLRKTNRLLAFAVFAHYTKQTPKPSSAAASEDFNEAASVFLFQQTWPCCLVSAELVEGTKPMLSANSTANSWS